MAEKYYIGQYRYSGTEAINPCIEKIVTTYNNDGLENSSSLLTPVLTPTGEGSYFQDILIPLSPDALIDKNSIFYIKADIARFSNLGESTIYHLKLVPDNPSKFGENYVLDDAITNFETIKTFTIGTGNSALTGINVALYQDSGLKVTIVDGLKVKIEDGKLNIDGKQIESYNEITMMPVWYTDISDGSKSYFEAIVSTNYYEPFFHNLLLEIERTGIDGKILNTKGDYKIAGRLLNADGASDQLDLRIYKVNKILPAAGQRIKKIGVQGRPGLTMAINGQEVKIGPSGIFEFDGIDITSFGVFAEGPEDKFVVDYQYITV